MTPSAPPRHALECDLHSERPSPEVRQKMAAFYRSNALYALQQHSHPEGYFERLVAVMESALPGDARRILEIGAGSAGAMRSFLARRPHARAIAIELSPLSLTAIAHGGGPALVPVAGDALRLPLADRSVDAVMAYEVIEHLPDVERALDEALRVVRRPGYIVIGLPNHASLWTPVGDALNRGDRRAFGVERGRGAWRWWRRNARLAIRKRLARGFEFLYREPILDAAQGGDADAVYYAAPVDLLRFFRSRGAELVGSSARIRFGRVGCLLPVEAQGSVVLAWRVSQPNAR